MHLVTLKDYFAIQFSRTSGTHHAAFEPGKPYLLSNYQFAKLTEAQSACVARASVADSRFTNFNALVERGSVLFWSGAGGFGDQMMAWPVARLLSKLGHRVHVMVDPGLMLTWCGFPWVESIVQAPAYYSEVKLYDHHCLFETVTNADEHPDQLHPVDSMLKRIGLDPAQVDAADKVVKPHFTRSELAGAEQMSQGKKFAIYQLASAGDSRSLSPERSADVLHALATAFPDWHWLAAYDPFLKYGYQLKAEALSVPNVSVRFLPNLRLLWALTSQAQVVVAPDSMMVHAAGSFGVPCVGLWGPTDPATRAKYYQNHLAIWKRQTCPASPCFQHSALPACCPDRATRECCEPLLQITPDEVVAAVKTITGS